MLHRGESGRQEQREEAGNKLVNKLEMQAWGSARLAWDNSGGGGEKEDGGGG